MCIDRIEGPEWLAAQPAYGDGNRKAGGGPPPSRGAVADVSERGTGTLATSELRYRRLFEASRDGILLLDADSGRVTDANPFMTELLGYRHDELVGRELWQIGLFADREASRAAFRHLREWGYIRYEDLPLETRRGERREVEFVSNVYEEDGRDVIQCNVRDITERKRMEEALRAAAAALEEAFARERNITDFLQRPLSRQLAGDAFPGLSIATLYEPRSGEAEVGGDFFDAFPLTPATGAGTPLVVLAVGDVAGKGLPAAALAGRVKDVLRAFLREDPDPAGALRRLNAFLCSPVSGGEGSGGGTDLLVALALVVIDTGTGTATFSSAGAEPPALLRSGGAGGAEEAEVIDAGGLLLGVRPDEPYANTALRLRAGDMILLATDGITEVRRPPRGDEAPEFLGYEGMLEIARRSGSSSTPVGERAQGILEGARAFGGGSFRDDVCLLLVRREGQ